MRILVIEDEHKIATALKKGLEQESFAVDIVHDGKQGLLFALSGEYDLIILDRMLPDSQDGVMIASELRQKNLHTPILLLTAKDSVRDRVDGLNTGADDYLVKPFAFTELLARVRALLRRPAQQIGSILTADTLTLNTVTFAVERSGQPINLSSKEYALLEYLMRHSGKILTKDALMSHVWNYDADILPNTVEVFIGSLRKKIDKPFDGPELIQTVRGFGYRLGGAA